MATYTYEQVREASVRYFGGDELAGEVFAGKYALQDLEGTFYELTPDDMHRRLAREFHRMEAKYPNPISEDDIFDLFKDWKIVPQGSPMSGIGNPFQVQSISNCFVIDSPEDSYGGICRADEEQAQIMKRRGGVGHDISCIRPKGKPAANAARTTDGIGVFMDRFSNTTREVGQNGRRGALMLSISINHPEVETFINIKRDRKRVTGANVSTRVTDEFMQAVKSGGSYFQRWPVDSKTPTYAFEADAGKIWKQMMEAAHDCAEPGVLFWDTIIRESPADCYADVGFKTLSTNPCGELPLPSGDSCRLMLMNLMKYVINPFTANASFDFDRFALDSRKGQRLMDDLVDLEMEMIDRIIEKVKADKEPENIKRRELELWKKIKKVTGDGRRTGLGITALGDTIAAMGLKYGSPSSIVLTDAIYKALATSSYQESVVMAEERGSFPVWDWEKEKSHGFVNRVMDEVGLKDPETYEKWAVVGRRNIANLTTSPAGTVSIETQTTSGGEPAIYLSYKRRRKINPGDKMSRVDFIDPSGDRWQEYPVFHHGHMKWAEVNGKDPIKDEKDSPYYGCTATEIDWIRKIEMQAAAQKWVDHSISNTTNVPKDTTVETVSEIYMKAWELGCKGVTIYREGSRTGVLVSSDDTGGSAKETKAIQTSSAPERPLALPCDIHLANVGGKQHLLLIGLLNGKPYEIFFGSAKEFDVTRKDKVGLIEKTDDGYNLRVGDEVYKDIVNLFDNPDHGAFTRTISTALRFGVPVQHLVEQMRKDKGSNLWSFSAVVARTLSKGYIADGTKSVGKKCPDCGSSSLSYQQGCVTCLDCGSGKCS